MSDIDGITIDSSSIVPMINQNQTQLIFQRHCNYDRENEGLIPESVEQQKLVVMSFIEYLKNSFSIEDLKNTYFLFTSSNTISGYKFKRCVETTNIAMHCIKQFFEESHLSTSHIINLNESSNYNGQVHESKALTEPQMFTDGTGYYEFLSEKYNGMNIDFWTDFEEDLSKEKREELRAEGPDQIVERAVHYIQILQRYAAYFHKKYPNSRLVIWNGTHYDLISPLVKQRILHLEKSFWLKVDYCGGISIIIDELGKVVASVNQTNYPFDFGEMKQPHQHF